VPDEVVRTPSDHLLRTLAAVPVDCRILDLACGEGRHTEPLALLGFDFWACDPDPGLVTRTRERLSPLIGEEEACRRITPSHVAALGYPDDHFGWVVAHGSYDRAEDAADLFDMLAETRRVLSPGGWVFAAMRTNLAAEDLTPELLAKLFAEAGFALAEDPAVEGDMVRGIFRFV
jgi:SAM-dependent methyltransferase